MALVSCRLERYNNATLVRFELSLETSRLPAREVANIDAEHCRRERWNTTLQLPDWFGTLQLSYLPRLGLSLKTSRLLARKASATDAEH